MLAFDTPLAQFPAALDTVWGWARNEATENMCLRTKALVQEKVSSFLANLASRKEEVKRRCHTVLQSRAEAHHRDTSHLDLSLGGNTLC